MSERRATIGKKAEGDLKRGNEEFPLFFQTKTKQKMSKHYRQLNMDFECLVRGNRLGQAMPIDETLENIRRHENMKQILKREKIK